MKIIFKPVGYVKTKLKDPKETVICCEKGLKVNNLAKIILDKKLSKGLIGIDKFSHLFIIYYLNKVKKTELITHPAPPSVKKISQVGVFASRSQYRPNPTALRLVKLIKVKGNELLVEGLDAIDGSPVLDIKPYVSGFDRPEKYHEASWYSWLKK